jgi:hypothetical protein
MLLHSESCPIRVSYVELAPADIIRGTRISPALDASSYTFGDLQIEPFDNILSPA